MTLTELNSLSRDEFMRIIGPVFEHSPWIAETAWMQRPFSSRDNLQAALQRTVVDAEDARKLELIGAHPDLAGHISLTDASRREQSGAGLDRMSADEIALFDNYNRQYREKFGFPFVICARMNKKDAILGTLPVRLQNSSEEEKQTALEEIFKIADLRLREILE
jgi:2-oxo-4-hydroxy-4-carboxy-5-ureidoimidazoline decarboxylase